MAMRIDARRRRPDRCAWSRRSGRRSPSRRGSSAGRISVVRWSSRAAANTTASASAPSGSHRARQQDVADDFGAGRAARLRGSARVPMPKHLMPLREQRRVRRLAGALAALEGDEASAHVPNSRRDRRYSRSAAVTAHSHTASTAKVSVSTRRAQARCVADPTATVSLACTGTSRTLASPRKTCRTRRSAAPRAPARGPARYRPSWRGCARCTLRRHHQLDLLFAGDRQPCPARRHRPRLRRWSGSRRTGCGTRTRGTPTPAASALVGAVLRVSSAPVITTTRRSRCGSPSRRGCSRLPW